MTARTKRLGTILTATIALAMVVGNAQAAHLRISERNIRLTWTSLEFTNTVNAETLLCPVTLEGSFHETTTVKTLGALVGYVTRASAGSSCTGGTVSLHQESLPWHITYEGFTGTLPNIEILKLLLLNVFGEIRERGGNTCSFRTEAEHPFVGSFVLNRTTGRLESFALEPNTRVPLTNGAGGIFCGLANGIFSGSSNTPTVLGSTTTLTVVLI